MKVSKPFVIYVDVDETFVRNYGVKRIPMPNVINHIKWLYENKVILYCWSSGGAEYAQKSAEEFGISQCFSGFLPKPQVIIDDQAVSEWRNLLEIHPNSCPTYTVEKYKERLLNK